MSLMHLYRASGIDDPQIRLLSFLIYAMIWFPDEVVEDLQRSAVDTTALLGTKLNFVCIPISQYCIAHW